MRKADQSSAKRNRERSPKAEKVIGIIGGMGPEATIDLFRKIVKATPARTDQEHLRILIDCNPKIPDRVKAIFEGEKSPAEALIAAAQSLARSGAGILLIPCNAAHYYHGEVAKSVSVPVLHMIEETARFCREKFPRLRTFGLLAASSTVALGLYRLAFDKVRRKILHPRAEAQERIMQCIYEIKAGNLGPRVRKSLLGAARELAEGGAQAIILGCTEVPLVLQEGDLPFPLIDPTQVLAEISVAMARR
ncbi:MAG: amino acid racemase [Syntrophaceae bacterium]|nr:amino acid racemase [Syntrophaceae bacterium]